MRVDHSRFGRTLEVVFILCLILLRTVDLLGFFSFYIENFFPALVFSLVYIAVQNVLDSGMLIE